ncbi:ClpP crotonase [Mucidula mucida]|nr:ClpP crotonase [Mucidula mucida]
MSHLIHRSVIRLSFRTTAAPRYLGSVRLMSTSYENIIAARPVPGVALITLNRPKALNALSSPLFLELNDAMKEADSDSSVGAIVLTGSEKAFAAGADIKEMKDKEFSDVYKNNFLENWSVMSKLRKPVIAAVSGFALGGGCELALMCDIILASKTAKFGQPEINLGVIPGGGGSQRLARAVGKSRAMEMEAAQWGMISRVVEGDVVQEALDMAKLIASKGQISVQAGKEVVNAAYELTLAEGLRFERRTFHGLFATKDQKEGMAAFAEKRKAQFTNE